MRTRDGGRTWTLEGKIGPEPDGFAIMPATVRLSESKLYTVLRRREGPRRWQTAWQSLDNGRTWAFVNDPVESAGEGNPEIIDHLFLSPLFLRFLQLLTYKASLQWRNIVYE